MDKLKQDERLRTEREKMIDRQLKGRGITNPEVVAAFRKVSREVFLPPELQGKAYEDHPLPIGFGQTISQPYIVALMTETLELSHEDRVLEVGTGSGYQTAILSELVREVFSVEIIDALHRAAKERLGGLGYQNINLRHGDGRNGWPEVQPFDKVIVTAGTEEIPGALINQLKEGGRIVIPLGCGDQDLVLGRKVRGTLVTKQLIPVRFVPLKTEII